LALTGLNLCANFLIAGVNNELLDLFATKAYFEKPLTLKSLD
jgi:hypothetical protein